MINQDENQIENSIFLDPFSKEVWESTYKYHEDKSVLDTFRRVARAIASVEATEELRKEWEEKFFDLLNDFKITAGGRIYSNAGTNFKGTTAVNCFVGPKPDHDQDSLEGIFKVLLWQAQTLKSEGGWGMNFSFIRPRGSYIHGIGVESPGAVKYMEIFDKVSDVITSGSGKKNSKKEGKGKIRKGAMMGCLSVNHPDIEEFIEAKLQQGRLTKFNLSVQCTNDFMDLIDSLKSAKARGDEEFVKNNDVWKLEFPDTTHPNYKTEWDGNFAKWRGKGYNMITYKTVSALGLWEKIMKSTYTRNDPGVLFTDIANKTHCWNYGENSYIAVSNPCQPKWATVLTRGGVSTLGEVNVGDEIWSKEGWTKIVNKWSTGVKDVYEYRTENNSVFNGTENHRLVSNGEKIEARFCEVIDCFSEIKKGVLENIKVGVYTHNVFETNPSKIISRKFISSEEVFDITVDNESHTYWTGGCNVSNCLAAGTLVNTPFGCKKIEDIKEGDLVSTLHPSGSEPVKTVERHAAVEAFEIKFSDGGVQYATASHIYHIQKERDGKKSIEKLRLDELRLGDRVQVKPSEKLNSNQSNGNDFAAIVSIKSVGQKEVFDLFCEESDTWITDGYVQRGCGEQLLPFGAICNLSSLNLTQFINSDNTGFDMDKIRKYVAYAVRFLDNVNSYTNTPLEQYKDSAENRRRIGLGVMGWGSALYILKVPFASDRAEQIKNDLMRVFTDTAIETSVNLAIEKGAFRDCDKEKHANAYYWKQINLRESLVEKIRQNGIRNSALFSIQPTGNTSILANVVSGGIEPVFLPQYIRTVIVANPPDDVKDITPKYWEGDFTPNSTFISVKEGGDDVLRAEINGTVYKIDKGRGLTKEVLCLDYGVRKLKERGEWDEKADWAKTALSIGVNEHVRDMRGWAFWIDSAISKTCNLPSDYPYEQFEDLYLNAYKTGIIKGITTYRDGTMAPVLSAEKPVDNIISADGRPQGKLKKNSAPKRGKALKGDFYHILSKGVKYYAAVGFMDDDPYEIFTGLNSNSEGDAIFPKTLSSGEIVKHAGGKYAFRAPNGIEYPLTSAFSDPNVDALTRMISTSLRHGVSIEFVVQQLEKTKGEFSSFAKILGRTLKHYIKDGKKSGKKCSECGGDLVYSEGCLKCSNCGYSKCG